MPPSKPGQMSEHSDSYSEPRADVFPGGHDLQVDEVVAFGTLEYVPMLACFLLATCPRSARST